MVVNIEGHEEGGQKANAPECEEERQLTVEGNRLAPNAVEDETRGVLGELGLHCRGQLRQIHRNLSREVRVKHDIPRKALGLNGLGCCENVSDQLLHGDYRPRRLRSQFNFHGRRYGASR